MVILVAMLDVVKIIQSGGLLLIGLILFAETGLLLGFFLPGDTLLFSAGFFVAQGKLPLVWLLLVVILAAIIGNEVGYEIGFRTGPKIFKKKDGLLFREDYIKQAEQFYVKHGGKTIILARFVPIIRTFSPIIAGVGRMSRRKFFIYNVIGALTWCNTIIFLGIWLGNRVPNIDKYILPAILTATVFTMSPTIFHVSRELIKRKQAGKKSD